MTKAVCVVCGKGPIDDHCSVYRTTPKGEPPRWACYEHYQKVRGEPIEIGLTAIVKDIEGISITFEDDK